MFGHPHFFCGLPRFVKFQFPARNSVCSDFGISLYKIPLVESVSIPRSEFCLFGPGITARRGVYTYPVSIPRSEFCLFGPRNRDIWRPCNSCFNSPLGILFVRTPSSARTSARKISSFNSPLGILFVRTTRRFLCTAMISMFQFPARNSVCSDATSGTARHHPEQFQFPARNSVCSDQTPTAQGHAGMLLFQFPARNSVCSDLGRRAQQNGGKRFQFPARNSVCSDCVNVEWFMDAEGGFNSPLGILFVRTCVLMLTSAKYRLVSIPRSEFCLFGQIQSSKPSSTG